jgi:hypothetical protein
LTRNEAFDLVRKAIGDLAPGDESVRASDVRSRARQLLGRDSESLSDRMFVRILKDAHDEGIIDLRKRGDDFEVARAAEAAPVSEQLAPREQSAVAASAPAPSSGAPAPRIGMGHRGAGPGRMGARGGRMGAPPPELLSIGVVEQAPSIAAVVGTSQPAASSAEAATTTTARPERGGRGRGKGGAKQTASRGAAAVPESAAPTTAAPEAKAKRGRPAAKKGAKRPRAKKAAGAKSE